jgi:hypothetical protein
MDQPKTAQVWKNCSQPAFVQAPWGGWVRRPEAKPARSYVLAHPLAPIDARSVRPAVLPA